MLADGDKQTVKVLYVEDSPSDGDLARRALGRAAPDVEIEIVGNRLKSVIFVITDP